MTKAVLDVYDRWHPDHDAVDVADIVKVMLENAEKFGKPR